MLEEIKHAAVKSKEGMIFLGKCHGDCFMQAHNCNVDMSSKALDQGFFTNQGRYVDRDEGAKIAVTSGQVTKPCSFLFSEDLWCERDGGLYQYDQIKGYHIRSDKTSSGGE